MKFVEPLIILSLVCVLLGSRARHDDWKSVGVWGYNGIGGGSLTNLRLGSPKVLAVKNRSHAAADRITGKIFAEIKTSESVVRNVRNEHV